MGEAEARVGPAQPWEGNENLTKPIPGKAHGTSWGGMEQGPGAESKAGNAFLGSDPNNINAQKYQEEKLGHGDSTSWEASVSSEPCQCHGKYFPPSASQPQMAFHATLQSNDWIFQVHLLVRAYFRE